MAGDADGSNVVQFPAERRARPGVALLAEMAPSRSLVDTLMAECGLMPHDAWVGARREFAHQAAALDAGEDRDGVVFRLRPLVDAQVAHATELCQRYRAAADQLIALEVRACGSAGMVPAQRRALEAARHALRGRAIAARVAADAALGAATALAAYIRDGMVDGADWEPPEQMSLFPALTG